MWFVLILDPSPQKRGSGGDDISFTLSFPRKWESMKSALILDSRFRGNDILNRIANKINGYEAKKFIGFLDLRLAS